jgi:di/tricarboxylate transporter
MTQPQIIALAVLAGTVATLIWGRLRSDVVALSGAALLLVTRVIRPVEVESAFASPAIIALASLFIITYAMELTGLLGWLIRQAMRLCQRLHATGIWIVILLFGGFGSFINNTPIVVLGAPVVRDVANALGLSPKRFLIPLSYITVLGGCCTLIGTSTNLLVNDMARAAGQPTFTMFEITPVGVVIALAGALYLVAFGDRKLAALPDRTEEENAPKHATDADDVNPELFPADRPLRPLPALASLLVFILVVAAAALGLVPIAASAFAGAVLLILLSVIKPEEAYRGLKPEVLLLIAGMVVIGLALESTGLATAVTARLIAGVGTVGPVPALVLLYLGTMVLTEILSNAAVAVLVTPLAVALAESLGVNPRPFLVAVMMAASAAFATPFGYQTNVLVYEMGRYRYMDFVRVGLPLNIVTLAAAIPAILYFFPL